jgi:hypothetical protein
MVIPPSGTVRGSGTTRGDSEELLEFAEHALISRGLRVISPAITGRVAAAESERDEGQASRAALSDMERALILAQESNAEAILQIGKLTLAKPESGSQNERLYFLPDRTGTQEDVGTLREVSAEEYRRSAGIKGLSLISGDHLTFTGRLVDVQTGEIMASFHLIGLEGRAPLSPYEVTYAYSWPDLRSHRFLRESAGYLQRSARKSTQSALVESLFTYLVSQMKGTAIEDGQTP